MAIIGTFKSVTLPDGKSYQIGALGNGGFYATLPTLTSNTTLALASDISNATITIRQTNLSDQTFSLNGGAVTITLADTNTWRPLGTGASDACAGNDSRLSDARPASDVYAWAKASTKPGYSYSEISGTPSIPDPLTTTAKSSVERWPGGSYSSDVSHFVTPNDVYYWNGAVTGTTSYLAYCNQGAFGSAATHSASDFYSSSNPSGFISGVTQSDVTSALGMGSVSSGGWGTITSANGYTVRWASDQPGGGGVVFGEKNGQTSLQVDGDIYVNEGQSRLARAGEAQPASDVYAWAKAANKPSYSFTELSNRYEHYLEWGAGGGKAGWFGPLDSALVDQLRANRVAGISGDAITLEKSNDGGSTWTTIPTSAVSKAERTALFTTASTAFNIRYGSVNKTTDRMRITMDATSYSVYTQIYKMMIFVSTSGSSGCKVLIETAYYSSPTTWQTVGTYDINGWSGWNVINAGLPGTGCLGGSNSDRHNRFIRFTFSCTGVDSTYTDGLYVLKIYMFGGVGWNTPSVLAATGVPYSYDYQMNVSFPATIYASTLVENGTSLNSKYTPRSAFSYSDGVLTISV